MSDLMFDPKMVAALVSNSAAAEKRWPDVDQQIGRLAAKLGISPDAAFDLIVADGSGDASGAQVLDSSAGADIPPGLWLTNRYDGICLTSNALLPPGEAMHVIFAHGYDPLQTDVSGKCAAALGGEEFREFIDADVLRDAESPDCLAIVIRTHLRNGMLETYDVGSRGNWPAEREVN